jgi:hypothetical protein
VVGGLIAAGYIAGYALSVLANAFLIGFWTEDEDALPFFIVPILCGPLTLALLLPFLLALYCLRLGARIRGGR